MNKIRIAVVLVFLLVMGVVLTVSGVRDIIRINGYVPDFNFDSMADIKKGGFVQGYVENIFDCYASETTTETTMGIETSSRTSEEYFLMPLINEADVDNELYVPYRLQILTTESFCTQFATTRGNTSTATPISTLPKCT